MFEGSLLESATQKVNTQITWYFLATMIVYAVTLSMLIVGSTMLMSPQLKEQFISATLALPPPPPPPPSRSSPPSSVRSEMPPIRQSPLFMPPTRVPEGLPNISLPVPPVGSGLGGDSEGGIPGSLWGVEGGIGSARAGDVLDIDRAVAPPLRASTPELPEKPRRVSGGVLQGNVIRRVQPVYPPIALSARVSGSVQIEVVIDENGNVMSADVVQGHLLLSQAALDAARQWKFRPTLLNGEPIKVTGVLVFNFRL